MDYRFYIIYVCLNSYNQRLSCSANCEDRVQNKECLVENLKNIVGDSYVIHEPEDLIVFEQDASVDRSIPLAVVFPASTEEVSDVVSFAYENEIPIVARGAGTGLSGLNLTSPNSNSHTHRLVEAVDTLPLKCDQFTCT